MSYTITTLEERIMREMDNLNALNKISRITLGGKSGPDGGSGSPPGGFTGQIAQKYVTFDTTEATTSGITATPSLVKNLNRIRGGWAIGDGAIKQRHIASGTATLVVGYYTGNPHYTQIADLEFEGATVTKPSTGIAKATISFTSINETPKSYTGQALKVVRVNIGSTGLEFATVSGGGGGGHTI